MAAGPFSGHSEVANHGLDLHDGLPKNLKKVTVWSKFECYLLYTHG